LKKSMACVNIAKFLSSISSLEMCMVYLNNVKLSLSTFALTHRHVAHSSILSITLSHFVPHVLISNKCQRRSNLVSFLRYSNSFFVILQILFNMLEINVYSIIDSKVFSVTFGVNSLLPTIKKRFHKYKYMV
jgi:hypothetical protein